MKPNLLLAASAALLLAACSSAGSTTDTASDSAATPTSTSAMPSQSTSPTPSPSPQRSTATPSASESRPQISREFLDDAEQIAANIGEGLTLIEEATGGMNIDNYSRADRKKALRGFRLLADAADIAAKTPLTGDRDLDQIHNDMADALSDFATAGVKAFSTTDPIGEVYYLEAAFATEPFSTAFGEWTDAVVAAMQ